jgi:ribosome recycling factor
MEKDGEAPADEGATLVEELQAVTDKFIAKVDELVAHEGEERRKANLLSGAHQK